MKVILCICFLVVVLSVHSSPICEDSKKSNCDVMKALCFKGVNVNGTLIEVICPKTCNACEKLANVAETRALRLAEPVANSTNLTSVSLVKSATANSASPLTFMGVFGMIALISLANNI